MDLTRSILLLTASLTIVSCTESEPAPGEDAPTDCGFVATPPQDHLQLATRDGTTCLYVARIEKCEFSICKEVPFEVERVVIGHQGTVRTLTNKADLTWLASHHNWADEAIFSDGATTYYLQDKSYDGTQFELRYLLTAKNGADVLWGPLELSAR